MSKKECKKTTECCNDKKTINTNKFKPTSKKNNLKNNFSFLDFVKKIFKK